MPSEPDRSLPERMPNPGSAPIRPEGSTDKFLWQDGTGLPGGPESQAALRDPNEVGASSSIEDAVDKVDGGSDGGTRDGGNPP